MQICADFKETLRTYFSSRKIKLSDNDISIFSKIRTSSRYTPTHTHYLNERTKNTATWLCSLRWFQSDIVRLWVLEITWGNKKKRLRERQRLETVCVSCSCCDLKQLRERVSPGEKHDINTGSLQESMNIPLPHHIYDIHTVCLHRHQ